MFRFRAFFYAFFLAVHFFCTKGVFCQDFAIQIDEIDAQTLPLISSIETRDRDTFFKQFSAELEENYRLSYQNIEPKMSFFLCKINAGYTVSQTAARLNLIADSWCIINGISSFDENIQERILILPTARGLFVPYTEENCSSPLEILLQKNRLSLENPQRALYKINGKIFVFFPDEKFSPTERAFFLDSSMALPVKNYRISSAFGRRKDPFGKNGVQLHKGVDMAVPEGSDVFSCKSGKVLGAGENRVYGKWILLEHTKGMSSFYAHLSSIEEKITEGAQVRTGELIAKSGSTGQVTGPHLHFEVRQNGNSIDPKNFVKIEN